MSIELCWVRLIEAIYTSGVKTNDQEFLNSDYGIAMKEFLLDFYFKKDEQDERRYR